MTNKPQFTTMRLMLLILVFSVVLGATMGGIRSSDQHWLEFLFGRFTMLAALAIVVTVYLFTGYDFLWWPLCIIFVLYALSCFSLML